MIEQENPLKNCAYGIKQGNIQVIWRARLELWSWKTREIVLMNKMRFSKNKQLHTERYIAQIQEKRKIQYKVIAEKTKKIWHAKKSITYKIGSTWSSLYSEVVKLMHLVSGFRYHNLKTQKKDNPGKNKSKYFEIK